MGQVIPQLEKIGQLSESGGTITLAPSRLTIGGRQYITESLNVSANLSSANTRYQIYAVATSGVASLVVSTNENSVGPVGYTSWKLVGSYYTNGLSTIGFGSFVNIEGVPETEAYSFTPTGGLAGDVEYLGTIQRRGAVEHYTVYINITGGSVSGTCTVDLPSSKNIDVSRIASLSIERPLGKVNMAVSQWYNGRVFYQSLTSVVARYYLLASSSYQSALPYSATSPVALASGNTFHMDFSVPIVGLTNTPIKDL